MTYETVAVPVTDPPEWPATWAEVPGERVTVDGTEYAVVSVPAGETDARVRRRMAPIYCSGGVLCDSRTHKVVGECNASGACDIEEMDLWPVELAGRESCQREPVAVAEPELHL